MNRKRIAQCCCAALVAAGIGLNIQNAIADYGIGQNSLSLVAGPGSNSNSNTNGIRVSNTNSSWITDASAWLTDTEKTIICVIKQVDETTSQNGSSTVGGSVGAGNGVVNGSVNASTTVGGSNTNQYKVNRYVCDSVPPGEGDIYSDRCYEDCTKNNPS